MENDTKTDYQEVVRAGHQKWEIAEIRIGIFVVVVSFRFIFIIFYIYREF